MKKICIYTQISNENNILNQGVFRNILFCINSLKETSCLTIVGHVNLIRILRDDMSLNGINVKYVNATIYDNRFTRFFRHVFGLSLKIYYLAYILYTLFNGFFIGNRFVGKSTNSTLSQFKFDLVVVPFPLWFGFSKIESNQYLVHMPDIDSLESVLPKKYIQLVLMHVFGLSSDYMFWVTSYRFKKEILTKCPRIFNDNNVFVIKHSNVYRGYFYNSRVEDEQIHIKNTNLKKYIYYPSAYRVRKNIEKFISDYSYPAMEHNMDIVLTCNRSDLNHIELPHNVICLGHVSVEDNERLLANSFINFSYSEWEASLPYVCFDSVRAGSIAFCFRHEYYNEDILVNDSFYIDDKTPEELILMSANSKLRSDIFKSQTANLVAYIEKYQNNMEFTYEKHSLDI